MSYGTGGPRISRPWGPSLNKYWLILWLQGIGTRFVAYERGVGIDDTTWRTAPVADAGNLYYAFGFEPHICYVSNGGSDIRRYNVNTEEYEADDVFTGANASISSGANNAGWLQTSWDGTRLVWQAPFSGPTLIGHIDLVSGARTTYNGAELSNVNEPKMLKGTSLVVPLATETSLWEFWFVTENRVTASGTGTRSGHSDSGGSVAFSLDPDYAEYPANTTTTGTAPASDGGAWNGSRTDIIDAGGEAVIVSTDSYPASHWDQTGNATEWMPVAEIGVGGGNGVRHTQGTWSVHSGSIYVCTITLNSNYGASTRGVNAVEVIDGSSNIIGRLDRVASTGEMTAGTFYWNSGSNQLYAWMADSSSPSGKLLVYGRAKLDGAIGYVRMDGGDVRKLCYHFTRTNTADYNTQRVRANWSPDGRLCCFSTTFGVASGRSDLIVAEVPEA
jgi:hypothetical protein